MTVDALTYQQAQRIVREAVKDKTYQLFPLGAEAGAYLRIKRKRLTESSERTYEGVLDKFARFYPDLELKDFEPPVGTERVEEFMDHEWGRKEARTYNRNLSVMRDFFKWARLRGYLHGDPTLAIEKARTRAVHRETFNDSQVRAIIAEQDDLRDRIALRLLLNYGLRKGALKAVQFRHFDHQRRWLTIFTKGKDVRPLPLPDPHLWMDLERLILDVAAEPHHYLMCRETGNQHKRRRWPDKPLSDHGLHNWWYRCLTNAGVVLAGETSGERMHKARHTAGQRILDATGNLKLTQRVLGHKSIQTTGDIYVGYDNDELAAMLARVMEDDE